ncbi:hypothetical protein TMES_19585 [Thalassospira mesophila]|uniref:AMP-dependent synthetase/ligase domain-containing protein n=2 Tax=Thalassospira mesophila TaxID=1293891 RepID=A0A1Y2KYE6_9PROT|nr:hypothetical protein TMES_19585 [Thalassospira mesophila]
MQLVQILRVNPLWQERLCQAGIKGKLESFDEWQNLPIMEREDLEEFYMGQRSGMVVPLRHGHFQIIASGGTSGGLPIETVYSLSELRDTYALAGSFFDRHILPAYLTSADPKWMITTLSDYEMWSSGSMLGGVLQNIPSVNFIHAGPMSPPIFDHLMNFAGPKAILGMAREISGLVELGKHLGDDARESFKLAFYGSGILQPKQQDRLKEFYPKLQILSYFASNQAEAIGIEIKPNSPLAAVPGLHLIEIVDQQGRWVAQGEEGELVITRLHAQHAPILRMKLGDRMVRRAPLACDDLSAECFDFAGRSSDIIHLGESHYAAKLVLKNIGEKLMSYSGWSLPLSAYEIQFQNNRRDKVLSLIVSSDDLPEIALHNNNSQMPMSNDEIRALFVTALRAALSLFDQTDQQFSSLKSSDYQFNIEVVPRGSDKFYRTGVNKTPLIKDYFG